MAAAITGGEVPAQDARLEHLGAAGDALREAGVDDCRATGDGGVHGARG